MKSIRTLFVSVFLLFVVHSSIYAQTYQELINKSADYISKKDYLAAEQALKAALNKEPANPGNALLLSNLGAIQCELKKYDEALTSYNLALTKYPNSIKLLHNRATLYCNMDSINKALNDYNVILLHDHNNIDALYKRALIHLEKKDLDKAEFDFEQIKVIDSKNILPQMGLALIMKRRGEWDKAEQLYTDLLFENRTNSTLFLNRAECYLEMKKFGRAQDDLNKAQTYGTNDPLFYILRGRLRLQQYDKLSAKADFMKARELGTSSTIIDELEKHCK